MFVDLISLRRPAAALLVAGACLGLLPGSVGAQQLLPPVLLGPNATSGGAPVAWNDARCSGMTERSSDVVVSSNGTIDRQSVVDSMVSTAGFFCQPGSGTCTISMSRAQVNEGIRVANAGVNISDTYLEIQ